MRLKDARTDSVHRGTRTDFICSRARRHEQAGIPFWQYPKKPKERGPQVANYARWTDYFRQFSTATPSTGLSAVFCAVEFLNPPSIALVGFDFLLNPKKAQEWTHVFGHDAVAENACLYSFGIPIIDLTEHAWPN